VIPGIHRSGRTANKLRWRFQLFLLSQQGKRRVALASFPRSGNTWFRFLLENATGEMTGNAGNRPTRILPRTGDGIVIKTHQSDSFRYTHAIHLVRNPFDVIDSYYDWKASLGWKWKYGELAWDDFVRLTAPKWRTHTRHWLKAHKKSYLIRYEDCVREPVEQFGRLLDWLERPMPDDQLRRAIEQCSFERLKRQQTQRSALGSSFFRRGQSGRGLERFTPDQRAWVTNLTARELQRCGYHSLLDAYGRHPA
jgi:hypothetical protein